MTVVVSFITPRGAADGSNGIGGVRVRENITIPGTTTETAKAGEMIIIGNGETSMVAAAFGTTPNADAAAETTATTAGFPIPAGQSSYPIVAPIGAKVNIKVVA